MRALFKNFIKEDPIDASLANHSLLDDTALTLNIHSLNKYYLRIQAEHKEEALIDTLIAQLDKKKSVITKVKIFLFLFHISKVTTYDITDLITKKKPKTLNNDHDKKKPVPCILEVTVSTK